MEFSGIAREHYSRGDVFRRMIVRGEAEMSFELSIEARRQLQLRYDLAVISAKRYVDAGFSVVYQDIVIGSFLSEVVAAFQPYRLAVVVLCPSTAVLAERDQKRSKTGYPDRASINAFDRILRTETPRIGYWLDNSDLTLEETVDQIMSHLNEAAIQTNSTQEHRTNEE